jgi:16S rRNA (adenine1518-N6/adenine1519-N6)-dimethyltransferase
MEHIPAKKSLGQNFLKSKTALFKMIEAGEVGPDDTILEVGPGKGVLTEKLLEKAKKVVAVEKDHRLIELLQEKFANEIAAGKFVVLNQDILDFTPKFDSYKIIANIPYYITGQFLRKFLENEKQPERIVVMVQKEIAQRIVAKDINGQEGGKESLLSISVKAYGKPKMTMKVGKENFSPAPKVDSAILAITDISKKFFTENNIDEKRFFEVLKAGFAHKRKKLSSNLKALNVDISRLDNFENKRAEEMSLEEWKNIL